MKSSRRSHTTTYLKRWVVHSKRRKQAPWNLCLDRSTRCVRGTCKHTSRKSPGPRNSTQIRSRSQRAIQLLTWCLTRAFLTQMTLPWRRPSQWSKIILWRTTSVQIAKRIRRTESQMRTNRNGNPSQSNKNKHLNLSRRINEELDERVVYLNLIFTIKQQIIKFR